MAPRTPKKDGRRKKIGTKTPGKTGQKIEKKRRRTGRRTGGKTPGKTPGKTFAQVPGKMPRKAPVSNVRDYDRPVRMETNRQIPLDCLLPYLAMGFTSQQTPGNHYQCGAYALAMSFNAAHSLLRRSETIPDPDNPTASPKLVLDFQYIDQNDVINILRGPEYQTEVDVYIAAHDPPTNLSAAEQIQRKKDMFRTDWLDHMQLECVLKILNRAHNTDFVLGIITGGWQGRLIPDTEVWDPDFLKLTDPNLPTDGEERANRMVVWLIYNNVNSQEITQRGTRHRQDHWEGFAPPSEDVRSDPLRVIEVQTYRVGGLVDQDLEAGVFIAIQNLASRVQDRLEAHAGAFLRPATAPGRRKTRRQGVYMRACNGDEGYVIQSQVRAIRPHLIRPSAATDASIVVANQNRVIQVEDAQTGDSSGVVEKPSGEGEIGTRTKINFFFGLDETDLHDSVPNNHETQFPIRGFQLPIHSCVIGSTTTIPNPITQGSEAIWVIDGDGYCGHAWTRRLGVVKPPFGLKGELHIIADQPPLHFDNHFKDVKGVAKSLGIDIFKKNKTELLLEVNDAISVRNSRGHVLKIYEVNSDMSPSESGAPDLQNSVPVNATEVVLQCGGKVARQGNIRVRNYQNFELEVSESRLTLLTHSAWGLRLGSVNGDGYPFLPARNAVGSTGDGGRGAGGDGGSQDVAMEDYEGSGGDGSDQGSKETESSVGDGDVPVGSNVLLPPPGMVAMRRVNRRRLAEAMDSGGRPGKYLRRRREKRL